MLTEKHPSPFELEAHDVGEGIAAVAEHLAGCLICRGHVADLRDEAARFAAAADPDAFARRVRQRLTSQMRRAPSRFLPMVALASLAGFVVLTPASPARFGPGQDQVRAKGATQVAIILSRQGRQSRHLGPVEGRPGDGVRIEISVPAAAELEAVLVDDRGSVEQVCPPRRFEAGTHYLMAAFAFDGEPTAGRLLVGAPASVRRALEGEAVADVKEVSLTSRGEP